MWLLLVCWVYTDCMSATEQSMDSERLPFGPDHTYERVELGARWALYTFFDNEGVPTERRVVIPRLPIISEEVIAADDEESLK